MQGTASRVGSGVTGGEQRGCRVRAVLDNPADWPNLTYLLLPPDGVCSMPPALRRKPSEAHFGDRQGA